MENSKKRTEVRLSLPHGTWSDLAYICLFTKDQPNVTPKKTQRFYKKLLNKHGIKSISQVIPLQTLKRSIKPIRPSSAWWAALISSSLTDTRIRWLLPSHHGRHFCKRKEVPAPVNLQAKNLSRDSNKSIGRTVLNFSKRGSCSTSALYASVTLECRLSTSSRTCCCPEKAFTEFAQANSCT